MANGNGTPDDLDSLIGSIQPRQDGEDDGGDGDGLDSAIQTLGRDEDQQQTQQQTDRQFQPGDFLPPVGEQGEPERPQIDPDLVEAESDRPAIERRQEQTLRDVQSLELAPPPTPDQSRLGMAELPREERDERREVSIGEKFQNSANAFMQGLGDLPASALENVSIISQGLNEITGGRPMYTVTEAVYGEASDFVEGKIDHYFPENPELKESLTLTALPRALGQGTGFIAGGMVGRGLGLGAHLGALTVATGSGLEATNQFQAAKQAGKSDAQAFKAYGFGLGLDATEGIPIGNALNRLNLWTGGRIAQALQAGAAEGIEEQIQEFVQSVGSNKVAQMIYDEDREIYQGVRDATTVGGGAGFILGSVTQGLLGGHALRDFADQLSEQTGQDVSTTEARMVAERLQREDGKHLQQRVAENTFRTLAQLTGNQEMLQVEEQTGELPVPQDPESQQAAVAEMAGQASDEELASAIEQLEARGTATSLDAAQILRAEAQRRRQPEAIRRPDQELDMAELRQLDADQLRDAASFLDQASPEDQVAREQMAKVQQALAEKEAEVVPEQAEQAEGEIPTEVLRSFTFQMAERIGVPESVAETATGELESAEAVTRQQVAETLQRAQEEQQAREEPTPEETEAAEEVEAEQTEGAETAAQEEVAEEVEGRPVVEDLRPESGAGTDVGAQLIQEQHPETVEAIETADLNIETGEVAPLQQRVEQVSENEDLSGLDATQLQDAAAEARQELTSAAQAVQEVQSRENIERLRNARVTVSEIAQEATERGDTAAMQAAGVAMEEGPVTIEHETEDGGYTVRLTEQGELEVDSFKGQKDGETVRFNQRHHGEAVMEMLDANRAQIDQVPRVPEDRHRGVADYVEAVADQSRNPYQLAEAYLMAEARSQDQFNADRLIAEWFADPSHRITQQSFDEFSDPVFREDAPSINANYLASDGRAVGAVVEAIRQEGIAVSRQQVVRFITENPGGARSWLNRNRPPRQQIADRFEEVWRIELTEERAEILAYGQLDESLQAEEENTVLDDALSLIDGAGFVGPEGNIDMQSLLDYLQTQEGRGFFQSFPGNLSEEEYGRLESEVRDRVQESDSPAAAGDSAAEQADEQRQEPAEERGPPEGYRALTPGGRVADAVDRFRAADTESRDAVEEAAMLTDAAAQSMEMTEAQELETFEHALELLSRGSDIVATPARFVNYVAQFAEFGQLPQGPINFTQEELGRSQVQQSYADRLAEAEEAYNEAVSDEQEALERLQALREGDVEGLTASQMEAFGLEEGEAEEQGLFEFGPEEHNAALRQAQRDLAEARSRKQATGEELQKLRRLGERVNAADQAQEAMAMGIPELAQTQGQVETETPRVEVDPIPSDEPLKLRDIVLDLQEATEKEVRVQNPGRGRAGGYYPGSTRTVIRFNADLPTIAHEIAHALDDRYGIVGEWANQQSSPFDAELIPHFSAYGSVARTGWRSTMTYQRAEGVAEWVRAWILNPQEAEARAPRFAEHFKETVPDDVLEGLREFSDQTRRFAGLNPEDRTLANVSTVFEESSMIEDTRRAFESVREMFSESDNFSVNWMDRLQAAATDELGPLWKALDYVKKLRGMERVDPSDDPKILIQNWAGVQRKWEEWIDKGPFNTQLEHYEEMGGLDWLFEPLDTSTRETLREDYRGVVALLINERVVERSNQLKAAAEQLKQARRNIESLRAGIEEQQQQVGELEEQLENTGGMTTDEVAELQDELDAARGAIEGAREQIQREQQRETEARETLEYDGTPGNVDRYVRQRTERMAGTGGGIFADDAQSTDAIEYATENTERYGRLKDAAQRYRQWADAALKYYRDKGRITEEQYEQIKEDNQHYAAMNRLVDEAGVNAQTFSSVIGRAKEVIHRFRGSTREINDPYLNLLQNTHGMIREADRNEALAKFRNLLTENREMYEGEVLDFDQVARRVNDSSLPNTLPIWIDGTREVWQFEEHVYEAMQGWFETQSDNFILKALQMFPRILHESIVYSPPFLIRNITRDAIQRGVISRTGAKPWGQFYFAANPGEFNELLSEFHRYGGGFFGYYGTRKVDWYAQLRDGIREAQDRGDSIISWPKKIAQGYTGLARSSEDFGRVDEYRNAKRYAQEELGYDEFDAGLWAANQARDITDYSRAGHTVREINKYLVFTNAAIQGFSRAVRGAIENPAGFAKRWLFYVVSLELMNYLWNWYNDDLEELRQQPDYLRDMFWSYKLGDDFWLRIPKPWEVGVMGSLIGRTIDAADGVPTDEAFDGWGWSALNAATPFNKDAIFGPLPSFGQAMVGYDLFRDRFIVPPWEQSLDVDQRSGTKYASRAGQLIQDAIGVDARTADFFIESQFADPGRVALQLSDIGRDDRDAVDDILMTNLGLFVRSPAYAAKDVQFVMDWARGRGKTHVDEVEELRRRLDRYYEAEDAATRDQIAQQVRDYAEHVRRLIENGAFAE